jgi:hypothetical protein
MATIKYNPPPTAMDNIGAGLIVVARTIPGATYIAYDTVAACELDTGATTFAFVADTETVYWYTGAGGAYTVDHLAVLATGNGGNTRWLAQIGRYVA